MRVQGEFEIIIPKDGIVDKLLELPPFIYDHRNRGVVHLALDSELRIVCSIYNGNIAKKYVFQKMKLQDSPSEDEVAVRLTLKLIFSSDDKFPKLYQKTDNGLYQIYLQKQKDTYYEIISKSRVALGDATYTFTLRAFLPEDGKISKTIDIVKAKFGKNNERELLVNIDSDWRLNCFITQDGNTNHLIFQKMRLKEIDPNKKREAIVDFALKVNGDLVNLYNHNQITSKSHRLVEEKYDKSTYIIPPFVYRNIVGKVFDHINPSLIKDAKDRIFVFKVKELDDRINAPGDIQTDEYNLLSASALLRQFLLDDGGTIPAMVKQWQCNLSFDIMTHPTDTFTDDFTATIPLDPHLFEGVSPKSVSLKELFSTNVAVISGKTLTVREVVKAVANGKGGVHNKLKSSEKMQIELLTLDGMLDILGQQPSLAMLREIGNVTLHALVPTIEKMMAFYSE